MVGDRRAGSLDEHLDGLRRRGVDGGHLVGREDRDHSATAMASASRCVWVIVSRQDRIPRSSASARPAVQDDRRSPALGPRHLDLPPAARPEPEAHRLQHRLLGGEASRVALGGVTPRRSTPAPVGEHPPRSVGVRSSAARIRSTSHRSTPIPITARARVAGGAGGRAPRSPPHARGGSPSPSAAVATPKAVARELAAGEGDEDDPPPAVGQLADGLHEEVDGRHRGEEVLAEGRLGLEHGVPERRPAVAVALQRTAGGRHGEVVVEPDVEEREAGGAIVLGLGDDHEGAAVARARG